MNSVTIIHSGDSPLAMSVQWALEKFDVIPSVIRPGYSLPNASVR